MKLEVVTIGTELVLGLTLDTNAADLGRALAAGAPKSPATSPFPIAPRTSAPPSPRPSTAAASSS